MKLFKLYQEKKRLRKLANQRIKGYQRALRDRANFEAYLSMIRYSESVSRSERPTDLLTITYNGRWHIRINDEAIKKRAVQNTALI